MDGEDGKQIKFCRDHQRETEHTKETVEGREVWVCKSDENRALRLLCRTHHSRRVGVLECG